MKTKKKIRRLIISLTLFLIPIIASAQNDTIKYKGLSVEYSIHYADWINGAFPTLRVGYEFNKHQFIIGPTVYKYTKGGFFSYQYYPCDNNKTINLYLGTDISFNREDFIRSDNDAANWKNRYNEGLLITGGTGVRLYFLKYLYLDWYMGLGYLWFHSVDDNIPNDWHYDITDNDAEIRINASIGFRF